MRYLMITYADLSFIVIDRTSKTPHEAIIGHQLGHFDHVSGLQWVGKDLITSSADLSVFLWKQFGDRWKFNYIDVAKCFDESLSFQRKHGDPGIKDLKLTALCTFPLRNPANYKLIVADNQGTIRLL